MTAVLKKSVFVHIPRTAGMWIRGVIASHGLLVLEPHNDYWNHCRRCDLPEHYTSMPSFSFIRHPLFWVLSRWRHSVHMDARNSKRFFGVHRVFDECVEPTFRATLARLLDEHEGIVGHTYREVTNGVTLIGCTDCLKPSLRKIIRTLEGVDICFRGHEGLYNELVTIEPIEVERSLLQRFIDSEREAYKMWKDALEYGLYA